jgi:CRISPR system Cascade subunit CasE
LHLQPDPLRLAAWAARHHVLEASGDLGYALHGLLQAAFGKRAPRTFRYLNAEQGLLAYTDLSGTDLQLAAALAPPDVAAALGVGATQSHAGLSARPFPSAWPKGHVLGFDLRVRPVIREGETGRERDAFLAAVDKSGGAVLDRGQVYAQWLHDQFKRLGGTELLDVTLHSFKRCDVMRKTQRSAAGELRKVRTVNGPDATLTGHLRVGDPAAFAALLARGVGRHRAFGYGMLMLRPADR